MSDGREQSLSWDAWLLSEEAKQCLLLPVTSAEYLQNRLWWAYMAGWKASEANRGAKRGD